MISPQGLAAYLLQAEVSDINYALISLFLQMLDVIQVFFLLVPVMRFLTNQYNNASKVLI